MRKINTEFICTFPVGTYPSSGQPVSLTKAGAYRETSALDTSPDFSMTATMGSIISALRDTLGIATHLLGSFSSRAAKYKALAERIASPPGLPVPHPTAPYWLDDPPFPHLVNLQNDIPATADIVIIGSGITAAASARSVLELMTSPVVVVIEARELCGGATGRNGGHIKVSPYEAYGKLKERLGRERALEVVRFQMRHLGLFLGLGGRFPAGEVRAVETVDLFLERRQWERAVGLVEELGGEVEARVWEEGEARRMVSLVMPSCSSPSSLFLLYFFYQFYVLLQDC